MQNFLFTDESNPQPLETLHEGHADDELHLNNIDLLFRKERQKLALDGSFMLISSRSERF